ncbi:hypothetical protein GTP44_20580 [Duganella sp. FT50W]|uniref:Uncharacterized protein n=1 Tax=Duganella lactea TaxID=2692173 RepID=A0A6L8MM85_9BURK|nr:hypothetical protein [Duganella lactea]MYM84337.1 hypothetical protein [Duganella lactea]
MGNRQNGLDKLSSVARGKRKKISKKPLESGWRRLIWESAVARMGAASGEFSPEFNHIASFEKDIYHAYF